MKGFIDFIREQGVVGLAVGFILGGAVSGLVKALIDDLVNPLLGVVLGAAGNLESSVLMVGPITFAWGHFANTAVNFIVIALVVYFGVKGLGLDRLDKKNK